MTPHDLVRAKYQFPFESKPFQIEVINDLAGLDGAGLWLDMGCGKSYCSTAQALYFHIMYRMRTVVIVPPILIKQWVSWLRSLKPSLKVTEYRGTPAERKKLDLSADFVVVGIQIFKMDYQRFHDAYDLQSRCIIVDEATMICNVGSDNHKKVWDFRCGPTILLTGTPANKPTDAYGLLKFTAPGEFQTERQFLNVFVKEYDFFGNACGYMNLDLLAEKLRINSKRVLLEDIYDQMPPVSYIPLQYDMEPAHYKLYKKLAEEQILMLENGDKIDATQSNNLIHRLGQIILNYAHFSGNPKDVSSGFDLIEETLSELGNGKLVVFANYRMTISNITQHFAKYNPVAVNSEITAKQKDKNVERFVHDPDCRMFVAQPTSAGYGIDGLQKVCNTAIFIEPCSSGRDFHQAVARLARQGQVKPVHIYLAVASKTLQVKRFDMLLHNDSITNQVVRSAVELRKVIYGE